MCSSSLQGIEVKEIGRQFEGPDRLPALNIGDMLLSFQSCGIVLSCIVCVNIISNILLESVSVPLSILAVILSGPGAQDIFCFSISLAIPEAVMQIGSIWEKCCMGKAGLSKSFSRMKTDRKYVLMTSEHWSCGTSKPSEFLKEIVCV